MTKETQKIQLLTIRLSLGVGLLMLAAKWWAYLVTGSAAILSDAAESIVHIAAVAFAAFSMWLSQRPPDANHPYGHEKVGYFSAGIEGALIVLAAVFMVVEAVATWVQGIQVRNLDQGLYVILAASLANLALGFFLVRLGRKTRSLILVANGKHVLTDSWTSFGVVAGLGLTLVTGWLPFDPLVAIGVALNIVWTGGQLIRQSIKGLMDEGDPELGSEIRNVLDMHTARLGLAYHALRFRTSGNVVWIDYHLLCPQSSTLEDAHRWATEIEVALSGALRHQAQVTSHLEPMDMHDEAHGEELRH